MHDPNASLEPENSVALTVVQALFGAISPAVRGVAIAVDENAITLHFAVTHTDEAVEEDVEGVVAEV